MEVASKVEKAMRDFLLSAVDGDKKGHLVSQNLVCSPKEGGLGVVGWFIKLWLLCGSGYGVP